jgi:hypothetical protein
MKHHGMIFNAEMVHAILDGRKTQTRRMVKPQPFEDPRWGLSWASGGIANNKPIYCERNVNFNPITKAILDHGKPIRVGDIIWVRETFFWDEGSDKTVEQVAYKASTEMPRDVKAMGCRWTPSIHMPRWASRIDLEVTAVRVERVQDISEEDALREGSFLNRCDCMPRRNDKSPIQKGFTLHWCHIHGQSFGKLWNSIYANWDANPWVWVYEFRRVK